ncbi:glycerophosphodiester phosphodiesterase family protein [Roseiconus nitratireducens]|nr:glycerophosphodiester phosphodiesterase family protein [Roseiconus nitratireducens]
MLFSPRFLIAVILSCLPGSWIWGQERLTPDRQYLIAPASPQQLRELFAPTGDPLPIVSAHRGGAGAGYPENCIATFEHTLSKTFSMLEVDPRLTRDGEVVLHHDATLDRTTTGSGRVADKTLAELKQLRLKDSEGNVTDDRIPTLDEALEWARGKTVLVLDQKDVPLKTRIEKIQQHDAESFAMLIVGNLADVKQVHRIAPDIMMEVMVPNRQKLKAFDQSGVPWSHVIAFLGHQPPTQPELYQLVHQRGGSTMVGTSRNLDQEVADKRIAQVPAAAEAYRDLIARGADIVETDLPRTVGPFLFDPPTIPTTKRASLQIKSPPR